MTKDQLRTGMVVTLRSGSTYMVMLDTPFGQHGMTVDLLVRDGGFQSLDAYNDDLYNSRSFPRHGEWDIMKVEVANSPLYVYQKSHYRVLWERTEEEAQEV